MFELYWPTLEAAEVDDDAAHLMTMDELRVLLPGAPLGHLLKILQACKMTGEFVYVEPQSALQRSRSNQIANNGIDGTCKQNLVIIYDVILVTGTLLLSIAAGYTFDVPYACSDGSECRTLRQLDAIFWTLSTFAFSVCVVTALLACYPVLSQREQDAAAFQYNQFQFLQFPMLNWVLGNQTLCGGFVTRMLIELPADLGLSIVLAAVLGAFNVVGLSYALRMVKVGANVTLRQTPAAFVGSLFGPSRGGWA